MSTKNRIDAQLKRAQEDVEGALERTPAPAPDADAELIAAQRLVADGKLVTASRTRNGALVTTKGYVANDGELHRLQENGALI